MVVNVLRTIKIAIAIIQHPKNVKENVKNIYLYKLMIIYSIKYNTI